MRHIDNVGKMLVTKYLELKAEQSEVEKQKKADKETQLATQKANQKQTPKETQNSEMFDLLDDLVDVDDPPALSQSQLSNINSDGHESDTESGNHGNDFTGFKTNKVDYLASRHAKFNGSLMGGDFCNIDLNSLYCNFL